MGIKLRKRKNKDGSTSLFLAISHNSKRTYEFLPLLKLCKPTSPVDRLANKEKLEMAEKIAHKRAQELAAMDYQIPAELGRKTEVLPWMQSYLDGYKKKDINNIRGVIAKFSAFLNEERITGLTFGRFTELIVADFQEYLMAHHVGEGASSYFNRFKKILKYAVAKRLIATSPAAGIKTKQGAAKRKDTLTLDEIQTLAITPTESTEVKKAFLFSCVTGLRWVDVKNLRWGNIDIKNRQLTIRQSKTDMDVMINLNQTAVKLLGDPGGNKMSIFTLPSSTGANKSLRAWVKRAGIKKEITWHCARHSFGTNLIFHGADISTASNLLGHTSLKHTQRYVRAANELKQRATDKLNFNI